MVLTNREDPSGFSCRASVFPSAKWICLGYIFVSALPLPLPPEQRVWNLKAKVTLIKWCGLVNNGALRLVSGSNLRWPGDLRFQTPQASRSVPSHTGPPPFLSNSALILWVNTAVLSAEFRGPVHCRSETMQGVPSVPSTHCACAKSNHISPPHNNPR